MDFFSSIGIDEKVMFRPMYKHQKQHGITDDEGYGRVVAVRFTKSKVLYDIVDEYYGFTFDNVISDKVRPYNTEALKKALKDEVE